MTEQIIHIVGDVQHWLDRLRIKAPRALCGVSLVADDHDVEDPGPDAPTCPACTARSETKR